MTVGKSATKPAFMSIPEVAFYLLVIPLIFTASVHFITAQDSDQTALASASLSKDMNILEHSLKDFHSFRRNLPFFSNATVYSKVSPTNEVFNYTLPLLGTQEFKIIKAKEELKYVSNGEKVLSVE